MLRNGVNRRPGKDDIKRIQFSNDCRAFIREYYGRLQILVMNLH